jgi:hypothetical protein
MPLTLSQFLFLVLTFAAVTAATFLVITLIQVKKTAREGERTLVEIRELVTDLKATNETVLRKVENLGHLVDSAQRAALGVSRATWFLSSRFMRPTYRFMPLAFPILRAVWRHMKKKRKEKKHGQ